MATVSLYQTKSVSKSFRSLSVEYESIFISYDTQSALLFVLTHLHIFFSPFLTSGKVAKDPYFPTPHTKPQACISRDGGEREREGDVIP